MAWSDDWATRELGPNTVLAWRLTSRSWPRRWQDSDLGADHRASADIATLARVRARYGHGTRARWKSGCRCEPCRQAHADAERSGRRARAQARLPAKMRQRLLNGIHAGTPFTTMVNDLGLTSQQVWGLAKTDQEWSTALETAVTTARRDDLEDGTNAAYVHGCACRDCRDHQQRRMGRNRSRAADLRLAMDGG